MSAGAALQPSRRPGGIAAGARAALAATWRDLDRRDVQRIALLLLLYSVSQAFARLPQLIERREWGPLFNTILSAELNGLAVMFAVLAVQHAAPHAADRWWRYALAVVGGVAFGTSLTWLTTQMFLDIPTVRGGPAGYEQFLGFAFRHGTHALTVCGLGTAVHVVRRRAMRRLDALREAQAERSRSERRLLEARLAAMQARVEPRFLLGTLARVRRLYDVDAAAADRVLRDLVRYLRAAIPQMRSAESTLGRELRLAEAYVAVLAPRGGGDLAWAAPGLDVDTTMLPPMLVLPLLELALHRAPASADHPGRIRVHARVDAGRRLVIVFGSEGDGFAPARACDDAVVELRERLARLCGEDARLELREVDAGSEAVLEMPYVVVAGESPAGAAAQR